MAFSKIDKGQQAEREQALAKRDEEFRFWLADLLELESGLDAYQLKFVCDMEYKAAQDWFYMTDGQYNYMQILWKEKCYG